MAGKNSSKFLPDSISGMLKSLLARMFGCVVCVLGLWAVFALLFYDPYLAGVGVASTFGEQSVMGNVVGVVRYAIGVIPGLFLFLSVARWGGMRMIALSGDGAPEYNFLRGFIAICLGAGAFLTLLMFAKTFLPFNTSSVFDIVTSVTSSPLQ